MMSQQTVEIWFIIGAAFFSLWWPVAAKVIFGLSTRTRNWLFLVSAILFVITALDTLGHVTL